MKKLYIFTLLAMAAMSAGCSKDAAVEPEKEQRTVTVQMVADDATRTTFNGDHLVWKEGDQVAYFIDNTGVRKTASIGADGTFTIGLDDAAHTVNIVYPVAADDTGTTYDETTYTDYPKGIPTAQNQELLTEFDGRNLPLTSSVNIEAGSGDVAIDATYSVADAAILGFTIKNGNTAYDGETLHSLVITSTDMPTITVGLPSTETISGATAAGSKVYVVIPAGTYNDLNVALHTSTASYSCGTDLTTKTTTYTAKTRYHFSLNISKTESVVRTAGLQVKLGDGSWTQWTNETIGSLITNTTCPSGTTIHIAMGDITEFTKANMTALVTAIKNSTAASRIALNMSAVKMSAGSAANGSDQPLYQAFDGVNQLRSFVFPTDGTNITSLYKTFNNCAYLASVSAIPDGVTNMDSTFRLCRYLFNQPIEIPASVTSMRNTFQSCDEFNSAVTFAKKPDGTTDLTTMSNCFIECDKFNRPIIIPESVTTMNDTFNGCKKFNQSITIPANVTNINRIFKGCDAFGATGTPMLWVLSRDTALSTDNAFDGISTGNIVLILSYALYVENGTANNQSKLWKGTTWYSLTSSTGH